MRSSAFVPAHLPAVVVVGSATLFIIFSRVCANCSSCDTPVAQGGNGLQGGDGYNDGGYGWGGFGAAPGGDSGDYGLWTNLNENTYPTGCTWMGGNGGYPHHGSFNAPNGVNYKFAGGGGGGGAGGGGGGHICQQTDNPAYSGGGGGGSVAVGAGTYTQTVQSVATMGWVPANSQDADSAREGDFQIWFVSDEGSFQSLPNAEPSMDSSNSWRCKGGDETFYKCFADRVANKAELNQLVQNTPSEINSSTPMWLIAIGADGQTPHGSTGPSGIGGYAGTVFSLDDYHAKYNSYNIYYFIGKPGQDNNHSGGGGAATVASTVPCSDTAHSGQEDFVVLVAGGGGGSGAQQYETAQHQRDGGAGASVSATKGMGDCGFSSSFFCSSGSQANSHHECVDGPDDPACDSRCGTNPTKAYCIKGEECIYFGMLDNGNCHDDDGNNMGHCCCMMPDGVDDDEEDAVDRSPGVLLAQSPVLTSGNQPPSSPLSSSSSRTLSTSAASCCSRLSLFLIVMIVMCIVCSE